MRVFVCRCVLPLGLNGHPFIVLLQWPRSERCGVSGFRGTDHHVSPAGHQRQEEHDHRCCVL